LKNKALLSVLRLFGWFPLSVGRLLGRALGRAIYFMDLGPAAVSRINLRLCYPQMPAQELESLCKNRMLQLGQAFFETPRVWSKSSAWLESKIVAVEGLEVFQAAMADSRGTILIVPHQGNWEVVGLWVSPRSKMTSLYEPPKIPEVGAWIKSSREQSGATLVPTDGRGVAALIKALKRGETTAILPDQQPEESGGIYAPFMGVQARTMTLLTNLIGRSGCQALFCSAIRQPGGWSLHFRTAEEQLYSEDKATAISALNAGVEKMVELAPEQYQWEYKRFRAQPDGSDFYAQRL
jgi:Kdo2-lipid IVA lauroyltransferase/acyltransferase